MRTLSYQCFLASACYAYEFGQLPGSFTRRHRSLPRHHDGSSSTSSLAFRAFVSRRQVPNTALSSYPSRSQTPEESRMTGECLEILQAAIRAVDPVVAIKKHMQPLQLSSSLTIGGRVYNIADYERIILVGFGKASSAMATAVVQQLQAVLDAPLLTNKLSGLIIVKDDHATPEQEETLAQHNIQVREAGHPVPDQCSVDASNELLELVSRHEIADNETRTDNNDNKPAQLVIACISGGGSSLFCAPQPPLTLQDLQATNQVLLKSGWPIQDMNVVRKRLDRGKGGRLAQAAFPGSHVVSLILSDVLGDPLDLIASGPTVPDSSTWNDAWKIVSERLPPTLTLPERVENLLHKGKDGKLLDSPSHDHPLFNHCHNVLVGNNEAAVLAAAYKAQELGYKPVVLATQLTGEASHVAQTLTSLAQHVQQGPQDFALAKPPAALISGGETTVTIPDGCSGKGGRNQEMALVAAQAMKEAGLRQIVFSSIGTDGTDGPTDAAGAIVDGGSVDRLAGDAIAAIANHDAYSYLTQSDDDGMSPLIKIGPTGTNVADVSVILIDSKE